MLQQAERAKEQAQKALAEKKKRKGMHSNYYTASTTATTYYYSCYYFHYFYYSCCYYYHYAINYYTIIDINAVLQLQYTGTSWPATASTSITATFSNMLSGC